MSADLPVRIENALRQADGLAGVFGDYTRQVQALLPLFATHRGEDQCEANSDLEKFREEVSKEHQQRSFQETNDQRRRDTSAEKLGRVHRYVLSCLEFGDDIDTDDLLGILEES